MTKNNKKNTKKGGNIKPIEEMIATQDSNAEKFLEKLEKLDEKLKNDEPMVEQIEQQIEEPIVKQTVEQIVKPIDEPIVHEKMKILNFNIKGAIHYNKNRSTKGITGKQYKSIIDGYKKATGVDMSKDKTDYIKKLNNEQAKSIIYTINMFNKKFNSTKVLAEAK